MKSSRRPIKDGELDARATPSDLDHAQEEIRQLVLQQVALAELSQRALLENSPGPLFDRLVSLIRQILQVDLVQVLELADDQHFLVRAGAGWAGPCQPGITKLPVDPRSHAGYTLASSRPLLSVSSKLYEPVITSDLRTEQRFDGRLLVTEQGVLSGICVVVYGPDQPCGVITAHSRQARLFTPDEARFLQAAANVLGAALQRTRTEQALREAQDRLHSLSRRLLEVQETERRHLARELHDEIGQSLTATKLSLQALQKVPEAASHAPRIEESVQCVENVLDQIRRMSLTLRPPLLDDLGLIPALRWHLDQAAQRAGWKVQFQSPLSLPRSDASVEVACFRIAQEALTNCLRHAAARIVRVELWHIDGFLHLIIKDNGRGFDVDHARRQASAGRSLGLLGMEERAALVHGSLRIQSSPGGGAVINAILPFSPNPSSTNDHSNSDHAHPAGR
jgi:signal transduction histidine kinase